MKMMESIPIFTTRALGINTIQGRKAHHGRKDKQCKNTNCPFSLSVKLLSTTSHHIKQFPDQKCKIKT